MNGPMRLDCLTIFDPKWQNAGTIVDGPRKRRHDTQHNDIQHYDTQHNDIQYYDTQHNNKLNATFSIMTLSIMALVLLCWVSFMLNAIMLSVANKPLCRMSLCWVSLCWMSWRYVNRVMHAQEGSKASRPCRIAKWSSFEDNLKFEIFLSAEKG
jgi:hypothetical protein